MSKTCKKFSTVLLTILVMAAAFVYAQELLPVKIQTVLIFKTLGYLSSPEQVCADGKICVGILFDENIANQSYSKDVLGEIIALKSANFKVLNCDIEPILLKFDKEETLTDSLAKRKIKVLYVITKNKDYLKTILKLTVQQKILSITGVNPDDLVKSGVSIGLALRDNKPAIITNTKSIKNEEKEFKKDFYSMVTAVE